VARNSEEHNENRKKGESTSNESQERVEMILESEKLIEYTFSVLVKSITTFNFR
jgi:hypothetical protein